MRRTPPSQASGSATGPSAASSKSEAAHLGSQEDGYPPRNSEFSSDAFWSNVFEEEAQDYTAVKADGPEHRVCDQPEVLPTKAANSDRQRAEGCESLSDSIVDRAGSGLNGDEALAAGNFSRTSGATSSQKGLTLVPEIKATAEECSSKVSSLGPSADGSWGPVPLSTLSSGLQDFVLRTIGNEVLRDLRYKEPATRRDSTRPSAPGKMSAAKQVVVSFDDVREKNLKQLRKLNQVLFPVRYEEKFYTDVLSSGEFTKLAYYSDICVGAIASKLEKRPEGGLRLYIMTLGVLAPYRRLGIASKLLQHCLDLCKGNPEVVEVYLHVQTSRDEAIEFYKQFGFKIVETLENYYKRIDPPHAYVLLKALKSAVDS